MVPYARRTKALLTIAMMSLQTHELPSNFNQNYLSS